MASTSRSDEVNLTARQAVHDDELIGFIQLRSDCNKACMFCGEKEISEKLYGLLYQHTNVICHYFCILLSSRTARDDSREGFFGFLLKDIIAELKRGSKRTCYYCKKKGATIPCSRGRCRKVFHLPCGLKNGSMHQYFQSFKSFCQHHRIAQAIDIAEVQNSTHVQCSICMDDVTPSPLPSTIWAPCCKHAWFHRECIQNLALSMGYCLKCPLCNNVEDFCSWMLILGIYIPSREASWESVPNAFAELLERDISCNAPNCYCPHEENRTFHLRSGSWEIVLCHTCGSNGTHRLCSSIEYGQHWICRACQTVTGGISAVYGEEARSQNRETSPRLDIPTIRHVPRLISNEPILISDNSADDSGTQIATYTENAPIETIDLTLDDSI